MNRSPGMGPRAPGSVGVVHAAHGEPESGGPVTGIAARRWRDAALASFRRRLEGFGRPARLRVLRLGGAVLSLRGSGAPVRACGVPLRELRGGRLFPGSSRALGVVPDAPSGASGGLDGRGPCGVSPRPGKRFRRMRWGLALGLAVPPAPGPGAEGFGCWFARVRRAGTRPRKGAADPLAVGAVSPGSVPPPEERRSLPRGLRAAEPATAHEASGRAPPRARSSGHPPPAPGASFYWGIRSITWPKEARASSWRFN